MPDQGPGNNPQPKLIQSQFDWDALAAPEESSAIAGNQPSTGQIETNSNNQDLNTPASSTHRDSLLENPLPGIIPASDFHKALHSEQLHTQLEVHLPAEYYQKIIAPLAVRQNRIPTQGHLNNREWRFQGGQSYENERSEFNTLIRIATDIGPIALLDHVQSRHDQMRSKSHSDNKYRQRLYNRKGTRSVIESTERLFTTGEGVKDKGTRYINLTRVREADNRKKLPGYVANGTIKGPAHPKEQVLETLIKHSPHLKKGGVVLVIVDDPATRDYLTARCRNWDRIATATNSIPAARKLLSDPTDSFSTEDKKISVVVINQSTRQRQLEALRKNIPTAYAALTVIYNTDVNVKTGEPVLNPVAQPDIVTKQAIELTRPGQKVVHKERLLKLEKALDDQGSRAEPPDNWWE